ncbi:MAG: hypothetical protein KF805_06600 [Phycisphaeraceae bacterium]|nr:hypothetical protein [Phycisphaeraceae bacterium]
MSVDRKDPLHPNGDSPDSIAFRAAMRDDPSAPGASDEGGPVAHGRIELGYPFEDADVLADLFLNDGPTVARIGPGGLVKPSSASVPQAFLSEPKPETKTVSHLKSDRPIGAVAAVSDRSRTTGETEVELLLVGHLPVLGSAWVLQYAKHVAQRSGAPVGLVRLSGGEATIDLTLPPSEVPPQNGPMPSIADAVRYVAQRTGRWIVRLDESADRATPADAASSIRTADRVTVLTGADEAAVVGCYRVIKTLEPGEATPRLHVAVMGSNEARADEAAGKLSRAAEKFLNSHVTSEACGAKITPGSSVNVYRGRPNAGHSELIALLRGGPAPAEAAVCANDAWEPESLDHDAGDVQEVEPCDVLAGVQTPPMAPAFVAPVFANASITQPATTTPRIEPPPAPVRVAKAAIGREPRGLARHLDSLETLASKCPYAPDVELALDPDGRLHLIARAAGDPGATLGALTTARSWAESHAPLMTMAHPRLKVASAVCHLMTDVPKSVRRLGDSDLRLHLLTAPPGASDSDAGWVCVELN